MNFMRVDFPDPGLPVIQYSLWSPSRNWTKLGNFSSEEDLQLAQSGSPFLDILTTEASHAETDLHNLYRTGLACWTTAFWHPQTDCYSLGWRLWHRGLLIAI
jgi:hypothetical protein